MSIDREEIDTFSVPHSNQALSRICPRGRWLQLMGTHAARGWMWAGSIRKKSSSALQGSRFHSRSHAQATGRAPSALVAVGSLPFLPTVMGLVFSTQGSLNGQILPAATFSLMHQTQHSITFCNITKLIKTISWLITML